MTRLLPAAVLRLVFVFCVFGSAVGPAAAQVTVWSPFNVPTAVDQGVRKDADVAYADGQRKKLDIYRPEKMTGPAPVVMFVYGGAWAAGERWEYEFVGRAFAAAGYVTVIPDYRLFPEVVYPDFLEDVAQSMKWVEDNIAQYGGDKNRFFIAGHSAGAYNSVMVALDHSFMREYGVTMPIRAVAGISGPYNFYPFEYGQVSDAFGKAPNPEGTQPVNLVTSDAPPMLLATGTSDPIVRKENTTVLAERLRAQGVWVTEKYYEGFGHLEPAMALGAMWRWRMPILQDTLDFFQTFGAFPSGVARAVYTPEPPVDDKMTALIKNMDAVLKPISNGSGR